MKTGFWFIIVALILLIGVSVMSGCASKPETPKECPTTEYTRTLITGKNP
jgi:hypothetical protein